MKNKFNIAMCLFLLTCITVAPVFASDYNYISPEKTRTWILEKNNVNIVDIQVEDEFKASHLPGSLATYSYPVKADEDRAKIDDAVRISKENGYPVVVVCPRGKGGAKRCYDYMKAKGIPESRLMILEKGMHGWPYKDIQAHN